MACHVQAYLRMYDVTRGLQKNGTFLLNTIWDGDELVKNLPNHVKIYFAKNNITVYYINANKDSTRNRFGQPYKYGTSVSILPYHKGYSY